MKFKITLEFLRRYFGKPLPPPPAEEHRRGNRYQKIYRPAREHWLIAATHWAFHTLQEFGTPTPSQLKAVIDDQSWLDIKIAIDHYILQLKARAAAGEEMAAEVLASTARKSIQGLEWLETISPEMIRSVSEKRPEWPVLISPNPKDLKRAKERVTRLRVGSKALTQKRGDQHLDPGSFWTRLVRAFLETCQTIGGCGVPLLLAHCKGVKPERRTFPCWETEVKVDYYYIDAFHCIAITDWERACVKLPAFIANENDFKAWWTVLKKAVLEYWHANPPAYQEALRQIGRTDDDEYVQRNLAIDRVEQSFHSVVGVVQ